MIQRNTIQCSVVLETVQKMKCHPSADEVYDEVVQHHPSISKGTVYRNLNRLVDMGRLGKIEVPDGADRIAMKIYHLFLPKRTQKYGIFSFCADGFSDFCGQVFRFVQRSFTAHSYGLYSPQLWVI